MLTNTMATIMANRDREYRAVGLDPNEVDQLGPCTVCGEVSCTSATELPPPPSPMHLR